MTVTPLTEEQLAFLRQFPGVLEFEAQLEEAQARGELVCPICLAVFPKDDLRSHFDSEHPL